MGTYIAAPVQVRSIGNIEVREGDHHCLVVRPDRVPLSRDPCDGWMHFEESAGALRVIATGNNSNTLVNQPPPAPRLVRVLLLASCVLLMNAPLHHHPTWPTLPTQAAAVPPLNYH